MEKTITISYNVHITYDGRLYRIFKDEEMVGYSDELEVAKEYALHYVND